MVGENHEEKHGSVKLYLQFAGILSFITLVEWAIFKIESLRTMASFMIPALLVLSVVKFVMVCGWYMHLKYDHPMLRRVFIFALALTLLVFAILGFSLR